MSHSLKQAQLNSKPRQIFKHRGHRFTFGCISYGSSFM